MECSRSLWNVLDRFIFRLSVLCSIALLSPRDILVFGVKGSVISYPNDVIVTRSKSKSAGTSSPSPYSYYSTLCDTCIDKDSQGCNQRTRCRA